MVAVTTQHMWSSSSVNNLTGSGVPEVDGVRSPPQMDESPADRTNAPDSSGPERREDAAPRGRRCVTLRDLRAERRLRNEPGGTRAASRDPGGGQAASPPSVMAVLIREEARRR